MVDAEDLKSFGHCDRVGSSPTIPTKFFGCVAQLVRALRSHRRGRRFESAHIHQNKKAHTGIFYFAMDVRTRTARFGTSAHLRAQ